MAKILALRARQILDSRGTPTIECSLKTEDGLFVSSVPSGKSTGTHEAKELRDGGKKYFGMGVLNAVHNINTTIFEKIKGKNPERQEEIDEIMREIDGTPDKHKIGANAILAVSVATCKAGAAAKKIPLYQHIANISGNKTLQIPIPAFNVINGGAHAGNKLDIQEHMIMPTKAKKFSEALEIGAEIYHALKKRLEHELGAQSTNVGDEGGFAPQMNCALDPFDAIMDTALSLKYHDKIKLAIDAAASEFWNGKHYKLEGKELTAQQLLEFYTDLCSQYPLKSIEDPFNEEAFKDFATIHKKLPVQIVGDDLLCTNSKRIRKAVDNNSCNCLLLKINQIGTITEALNAARLAKRYDWNIMVSHRSGETNDSFIADFAVGIGANQIKAGAPARGERLAKYNRLLEIEQETGAKYAKLS
jgi:enolase